MPVITRPPIMTHRDWCRLVGGTDALVCNRAQHLPEHLRRVWLFRMLFYHCWQLTDRYPRFKQQFIQAATSPLMGRLLLFTQRDARRQMRALLRAVVHDTLRTTYSFSHLPHDFPFALWGWSGRPWANAYLVADPHAAKLTVFRHHRRRIHCRPTTAMLLADYYDPEPRADDLRCCTPECARRADVVFWAQLGGDACRIAPTCLDHFSLQAGLLENDISFMPLTKDGPQRHPLFPKTDGVLLAYDLTAYPHSSPHGWRPVGGVTELLCMSPQPWAHHWTFNIDPDWRARRLRRKLV